MEAETRNLPRKKVLTPMGKIVKVSGPLVVATGMEEANMADVVRVGEQRLIGEILTMTGGSASILSLIHI